MRADKRKKVKGNRSRKKVKLTGITLLSRYFTIKYNWLAKIGLIFNQKENLRIIVHVSKKRVTLHNKRIYYAFCRNKIFGL